jgi:hypothetical protein
MTLPERADYSLTESALSPFPAEPAHTANGPSPITASRPITIPITTTTPPIPITTIPITHHHYYYHYHHQRQLHHYKQLHQLALSCSIVCGLSREELDFYFYFHFWPPPSSGQLAHSPAP